MPNCATAMRLSTRAANIVDTFPAEKSAVALVQSVEDSVQHDLGGSFLTDHQLIFKMPMGHVAQVFVAMHPYLHVLVKNTPFLAILHISSVDIMADLRGNVNKCL